MRFFNTINRVKNIKKSDIEMAVASASYIGLFGGGLLGLSVYSINKKEAYEDAWKAEGYKRIETKPQSGVGMCFQHAEYIWQKGADTQRYNNLSDDLPPTDSKAPTPRGGAR